MRFVKIWGGAMGGLLCAFVLVFVLLRGFVLGEDVRVGTDTVLMALVVITVPFVVGPALGAYLAARLITPAAQPPTL